MTLHRIGVLAIVLAMASAHQARGQFGGMPGSPGMEGPGFGLPPARPPAACQPLMTLRDEYQKNGVALGAAQQRKEKIEPVEACKLFNAFLDSEGRFIQAMEESGAQCGVTDQAIKQFQDGHGKASRVGKQVCNLAAHSPSDDLRPTIAPDNYFLQRLCPWAAGCQRSTTFGQPFLFDGIVQKPGP
jgi:hypothetical protein